MCITDASVQLSKRSWLLLYCLVKNKRGIFCCIFFFYLLISMNYMYFKYIYPLWVVEYSLRKLAETFAYYLFQEMTKEGVNCFKTTVKSYSWFGYCLSAKIRKLTLCMYLSDILHEFFWYIFCGFTYKSAEIKIWRFQCAKMLLTVMAKGEMAKVSCHQIG